MTVRPTLPGDSRRRGDLVSRTDPERPRRGDRHRVAIGLVVAVGVALSLLSLGVPLVDVLGSLLLIAVLGLAFFPIYYVLSPADMSIREVIPGATVAAGGWVLLQLGFRTYATNASRYGAYGMISAILLFVTWLYFASIVVLLGGAVNVVLYESGLKRE